MKSRIRVFISSLLAIALMIGGASLMIMFDHHSLAVIWTDPVSIFWSNEPRQMHAGPYWFIGPLLIFAGAAVIAEDWFGFGQRNPEDYSGDSASRAGKMPAEPAYEHDQLEPPRASISRSWKRPQA